MTNDILRIAVDYIDEQKVCSYRDFLYLYEMYRENVGIERSVMLALHELGLLTEFIDSNWSKLSCISPTTMD